MSDTKNNSSHEGDLPNRQPQAPRSIPLNQIGDNRAGNMPYNGDASNSRMRSRTCPVDAPKK